MAVPCTRWILVKMKNSSSKNIHFILPSLSKTRHLPFLYRKEYTTTPWLYERAPAARGQGVVAFFDRLTDLKAEKTAVFALIRLRNTAVYLFSATSLRIFAKFCTPKCAMYPFVLALPHSQLSLYEPTLSFNFLFLLSIIFYISFPIQNITPKYVLCHKI